MGRSHSVTACGRTDTGSELYETDLQKRLLAPCTVNFYLMTDLFS